MIYQFETMGRFQTVVCQWLDERFPEQVEVPVQEEEGRTELVPVLSSLQGGAQ